MIFSSNLFLLLFLPTFLLAYYAVSNGLKNRVALAFSVLFYAISSSYFVFVILVTTYLDFLWVRWMYDTPNHYKRKTLLVLSVCINLSLLAYFKYSFFLVENINVVSAWLGGDQIHWINLVAPLGISFYTFESLTYIFDVYRGKMKPLENFYDYQLYIMLFPKMLMGPIMCYSDISTQMNANQRNHSAENRMEGFYRFIVGLVKKVFIADVLAVYVDGVFNMPVHQMNTLPCWLAMIGFTFQLYFDFSGYTDMAIGIGRMMGFKLTENFNNPYLSESVNEFWRRWHITLGSWMRNYLYIPLGGSKTDSSIKTYLNLLLVFFVVGWWHGANWTLVLWGTLQGVFVIAERIFLLKILQRAGNVISTVYSFSVFMFTLVLLRSESINHASFFYKQLFVFNNTGLELIPDWGFFVALLIAAFFSFFAALQIGRKLQKFFLYNKHSLQTHIFLSAISLVGLIAVLFVLSITKPNPFVYFQY